MDIFNVWPATAGWRQKPGRRRSTGLFFMSFGHPSRGGLDRGPVTSRSLRQARRGAATQISRKGLLSRIPDGCSYRWDFRGRIKSFLRGSRGKPGGVALGAPP